MFVELAASLLRGESRSVLADAQCMLAGLPREPVVSGLEHVPASGGFVIVANHYQRWDLWIGWEGALLMQAIGRPIHWLVLRELRLAGHELPLTRLLFRRVAATYGLIPVPATPAESAIRSVRHALRLLQAGEVVGLFPEGPHGHARALSPALPSAAKLAFLLSRHAPLIPAAIYESHGQLHAKFGDPFQSQDAGMLMPRIARLLP